MEVIKVPGIGCLRREPQHDPPPCKVGARGPALKPGLRGGGANAPLGPSRTPVAVRGAGR